MKRLFSIFVPLLFLVGCSHKAEQAPLYQRYASRQDIAVAQVGGFLLCDTVKIDVVILVADDSAAWQELKDEFDIRTSEGVTSWMGNIDDPTLRVKGGELPAWRAMAVHADRTIAFYRIDTDAQYDALLDYQFTKMENE